MVAIAAIVMQQDCRSLGLGDEQVRAAVTIKVRSNQGTRISQLDRIEANLDSYILEAVLAYVAKEPDFFTSILCFTYGCQINPAVIVIVERSHAPGTPPVLDWKLNLLHAMPFYIAPEGNSGSTIVG